MRNERPWAANALHALQGEHSTAQSPTRPDAAADDARGRTSIDAQILQMLRTRLRTTGSLESVAGEIRRLGTLAAATHRASRAGLASGTGLAMSVLTAADGRGLDQSEDAA